MTSAAIRHLSGIIDDAALAQPDHVGRVVTAIKDAAAKEADPYLLIGVMIEGIVQTLIQFPAERQGSVIQAAICLLGKRVAEEGLDVSTTRPHRE